VLGNSTNVTIGPHNHFFGILQSLCGVVHCDAIQDFGAGPGNIITSNYFENGDTFVMAPDGSTTWTVTNNIFDGSLVPYPFKIQFGSAVSPVLFNNTIVNVVIFLNNKTGNNPPSSNAWGQNNILINGSEWNTSPGLGCSNCTFSYNLFDSSALADGTNNVIGTPLFTGDNHPQTWAGWQLN
jgi:hypothetical protein